MSHIMLIIHLGKVKLTQFYNALFRAFSRNYGKDRKEFSILFVHLLLKEERIMANKKTFTNKEFPNL